MPLLGSAKFPLILRTRTVAEAAAQLPNLHEADARAILVVDPTLPADLSQLDLLFAPQARLPAGKLEPGDPCPCGSGRKLKACCARQVADDLPRGRDEGPPGLPKGVKIGRSILDRNPAERSQAGMQRALAAREFESIEEANAFLARFQQEPPPAPTDPRDQAQELVYDAWEARTVKARLKLVEKALALDPGCPDALTLLAEEGGRPDEPPLALLDRAAAEGERRFEPDVKPTWWRDLDTRPYMRARAARARARWAAGRREEAAAELGDLLRLNPGDNQGLRYWLGPWLVELGKLPTAAILLRSFGRDGRADWLYLATLLAFAQEGATPYVTRLLAEALVVNGHVPDFLLGHHRLPKALPEQAGAGDENEAVACAIMQGGAWHALPRALAWLKGSLA